MLVDDDLDDQMMFCEVITKINPAIKCHVKKDGVEALLYLNLLKDLPDIIFLDMNMPRMDGKQCLREFKKNDALAKIPVVIYSTHKSEMIVKETALLGANYYLKKPIKPEELYNSITLILSTEF